MMRKTTSSISDEEVAKIVSEVDLDGDGTINFDGKRTKPPVNPYTSTLRSLFVDYGGSWLMACFSVIEFITMMTGQPYKSPGPAAAAAGPGKDKAQLGGPPSIAVSSAAAVRGVSTVSAKLQRQRLANQIYKDAWMEVDSSLKGSITPTELKQVAAKTGLAVTDNDLFEMVDPAHGEGVNISCEWPSYDPVYKKSREDANPLAPRQMIGFSNLPRGRKSWMIL